MPKFGVILSGCGVYDGSEIHEAVFTLLSLDQLGAAYQCMAPDASLDTIDHLAGKPAGDKRNVLVESARIARGNVVDLATVKAADFDGFILPGGYGAAKNLCTFATHGPDCTINPQVARVLKEAHALGKPIGLICIAPALGAKLLADKQVKVTIGHDAGTAEAIKKTGATHQACGVNDIVVDEKNRVVSTPAYMEAKSIKEAYAGISKLVGRVVEMAGK
jgi:enhancing lycopene biosynthesis protein 2